jgi:hypothetical protein
LFEIGCSVAVFSAQRLSRLSDNFPADVAEFEEIHQEWCERARLLRDIHDGTQKLLDPD